MDINAPELYIPFMAFDSYVVLTGFSLGVLEALAQHSLVLSYNCFLIFLVVYISRNMLFSIVTHLYLQFFTSIHGIAVSICLCTS